MFCEGVNIFGRLKEGTNLFLQFKKDGETFFYIRPYKERPIHGQLFEDLLDIFGEINAIQGGGAVNYDGRKVIFMRPSTDFDIAEDNSRFISLLNSKLSCLESLLNTL